jgi:TRAP-type uncharacterized transport system fused permease subunit
MADITPPVGLASFAAAAISREDPIATGFQGAFYALRTALLPFIFIFNPEMLLIDVGELAAHDPGGGDLDARHAGVLGRTMGWFATRSRVWETCVPAGRVLRAVSAGLVLELGVAREGRASGARASGPRDARG